MTTVAWFFSCILRKVQKRCFFCTVMLLCALIILSSWARKKRLIAKGPDVVAQHDLDHFAKNLGVNYKIIQNLIPVEGGSPPTLPLTEHEVSLTNNGRDIPPEWEIFFNQIQMVEPFHYPYHLGLNITEHNIQLFHGNGELYSFRPLPSFGIFKSGTSRVIRFYASCCNFIVTDVIPNWYITMPGLNPVLIESTVGEPDKFVHTHDKPLNWKRWPHGIKFDSYDPPTSYSRHETDAVKDLGTAPLPIIPSPVSMSVYNPESSFNVVGNDQWVVISPRLFDNEADIIARQWSFQRMAVRPKNFYIEFVEQEVFVESHGVKLPPDECYELSVDPNSRTIIIKASHPHGAFYAVQSLFALVDTKGNIPEVFIIDGPRYKYRGILIDVARNFYEKETIMRVIDVMAMYKLNKLHLHLTDDEGWRLEIPNIEELTQVGSTRCHDPTRKKCLPPFLGSGPHPSGHGTGYYTVEDYKDILRHAVSRHVEVIPEVDMPGHSFAAIRSMEVRMERLIDSDREEAMKYLLTDLKERPYYKTVQNFRKSIINPCIHSTYVFVKEVVHAIIEMHKDISPLRVLHLGGDEVASGAWKMSKACKNLPHMEAGNNLQKEFGVKVAEIVSSFGVDLAFWEDGFVEGNAVIPRTTFPQKNVYTYSWFKTEMAYPLADAGYKVILTPAAITYLDHPYDPHPDERGLSWAIRFTNTKKIFQLVPENFYVNMDISETGLPENPCKWMAKCPPLQKRENIEGIQGTLFGELIRSESIMDYMLLPRILALAERAWHTAPWEYENKTDIQKKLMEEDWVKFANSVGYREMGRLDKLDYKYRIPPPGAIISGEKDPKLVVSVAFPGLVVEMSQDKGRTWKVVDKNNQPIHTKELLVRTKAPSANRYSKVIPVSNKKFRP